MNYPDKPQAGLSKVFSNVRARIAVGHLGQNALLGTAWQLARIALQVLTIFIVARAFGPSGYGTLTGVTGLATSIGCLVGFGTGFLLLRAVSRDRAAFSYYWRKAFVATSLSGVALAIVFCLIAVWFVGEHVGVGLLVLIAISEVVLYPFVQLSSWAFQAHERLGWANALPTLMAAARLVAAVSFLTLFPGRGLADYLWFYLLASALIAVTAMALVRLHFRPTAHPPNLTLGEIKEGLGFTAQWFTSSAMTEVDKTMVLRLAGSEITGLYSAAYRLATAFSLPIGALVQAAVPRLFQDLQDRTVRGTTLVKKLVVVSLCYAAIAMAFLQFAALLLPMVLGPGFNPSVSAARWLALWLPLYGLRAIGSAVLMTTGHQLLRAASEVGALIALLGLALALVPKYQLAGAVAAAVLAEAMLAILTWAVIWKSRAGLPTSGRQSGECLP